MQHQRKKLMQRFDELASEYDKWYQTPLGSLSDILEKAVVFSLANVKHGGLALDVSCGTGNYALELARKGAKVIGIDTSKKMLKIAINKTEENMLEVDFLASPKKSLVDFGRAAFLKA